MKPLNTTEMIGIASEIVQKEIASRGIGCIEGEIILALALDRLRSQRYCEIAKEIPPDMR